ncbi:MAG: hypothetical protein AVO33_00750 [delta proteobacterium ML8_F1]|nr:MAG: hypothetical protein AVO33_00750 [delta proteobacterium ML8_F1]
MTRYSVPHGVGDEENGATSVLGEKDVAELARGGVIVGGGDRSGTVVFRNHTPVCFETGEGGVELMPVTEALKRYDWVKEQYFFQAVEENSDETTRRCARQEEPAGFFIRVREGTRVVLPFQAAMYMTQQDGEQIVHNIVIVEKNASLELITGCLTRHDVLRGSHLAVEEYYVGPGAKLISTKVHSWGPEVRVNSRSGAVVAERGLYESRYISLQPAREVVLNPMVHLKGREAVAKDLTIVLSTSGTTVDAGGVITLSGRDTSAELLQRGVCTGGTLRQGGLLVGEERCRAHVDCAGMLLDESSRGRIVSVPGLESSHPDARMSHEASLGKIAPDQVEYLMSRGMAESEAVSLLIRGFLGVDLAGLGKDLDRQIERIVDIAGHGEA